jgi:uncharacterized membrane protein
MNTQDEYHNPCPGCLIALPISVTLWVIIILAIMLLAKLIK